MIHNDEIKQTLCRAQPYGAWIREEGFTLEDIKPYARRPAKQFSWSSTGMRWASADQTSESRETDPTDAGLR
eukprot:CAMPEP_0169297644 /NCGR_PEP_ID=MMETSP1016-20121227/65880_1 /TAXON_ID=342587 /ORGANISM="Karlodinium micrum, Strain CCMP2283" /LENGTH=71 /DNA_ID=CAMNT_0009389309 /DNA_START=1 /DNA_END=213 /DNA_ORIENTATION=-